MKGDRPIRVCCFASYLWPSFGEGIAFAGGAEVQQAAIVRGLAARGFEVTVATCDYGQGRRVEREGITFLATHPPDGGLPVLRFFHPRLSGNLRALLASRAEVFYVRGAGMQAGLAFDVARRTGAGLVLAAAHDDDTSPALPLVPLARDRWWAARAIRGADVLIAQTLAQQAAFRAAWGRESIAIPNLVAVPPRSVDAGQAGAVLWLSTYKDAKRPEWVVELARRLPARRFVMAGVIPPPPLTAAVYERIRDAARALPNLEVRGHVARAELAAFFAEGSLFLHTSPHEGFPNTLLEAWAHGLPAVSIFDPDGISAREGLGEVTGDLPGLESAVSRWMADPAARRAAGARARAYVESRHAPDRIVSDVAAAIAEARRAAVRRRERS